MLVEAPKDMAQANSEEWQRKSFLFSLLVEAEAKASSHPEWELISQYWMGETPTLVAKTRDTIYAEFTAMFDPLTRGKIGELFGTSDKRRAGRNIRG